MPFKADGREIVLPGVQGRENKRRRWANGTAFRRDDGKVDYLVCNRLHWYDEQAAEWEEYDLRFEDDDGAWDKRTKIGDYRVYLNADSGADWLLRLERAGYFVQLAPFKLKAFDLDGVGSLQDLNTLGVDLGALATVTGATAEEDGATAFTRRDRATWAGIYGPTTQLDVYPSEAKFDKVLTVDTKPPVGVFAGASHIVWAWKFQTNAEVRVDGQVWNETEAIGIDSIEFWAAGARRWAWTAPIATDSAGDIHVGTLHLLYLNDTYYVAMIWSKQWFGSATYPVYLDPTTYYADSGDGMIRGLDTTYSTARTTATNTNDTANALQCGQWLNGSTYYCWGLFIPFDTSGINDATVVTDVKLKVTPSAKATGTNEFNLQVTETAFTTPLSATDAQYVLRHTTPHTTIANTSGMVVNTTETSPSLTNQYVNITGTTHYILVSDRDVAATTPTGNEYITVHMQEAATQAYRPQLVVTGTEQPAELGEFVEDYGWLRRHIVQWTSDADGQDDLWLDDVWGRMEAGVLYRLTTIPDGGDYQPTANYDVSLRDDEGTNVLFGLGTNRSNTAAETVYLWDSQTGSYTRDIATSRRLRLQVRNAGARNAGVIILEFLDIGLVREAVYDAT